MKTLAFGTVGEVFVLLHGKLAPSDEEWNQYLDAWAAHFHGRSRTRTLIVTDGAAPQPAQWQRVMTHPCSSLFRLPTKICLVTESTFVRGVVRGMDTPALNPLNGQYQFFAKGQITDALRALDISPAEQRTIVAFVDQLRQTLGKS
ncbi:hypothetical protein WME90_34720 [Sorangium sp. So ce375]|uniref:hypothetical protein n=1 Tax=Sorangium sp. So ce375 TaxID=3133306 RepID=UPI003F5BD3D5